MFSLIFLIVSLHCIIIQKTTRRHPQPPSQPKTKQAVPNSRIRSPPVRSKVVCYFRLKKYNFNSFFSYYQTPLKNDADDDDIDDHKIMNNNNEFAMNNGHQRTDSYHEMNNNDYNPHTPPVPPEIDDEINEDRNVQETPHLYDQEIRDSYDQEQLLSPNVQV